MCCNIIVPRKAQSSPELPHNWLFCFDSINKNPDHCGLVLLTRKESKSLLEHGKLFPCVCKSFKSFEEAEAHCEGMGARLCTQDELFMGEAAWTGCGYDGYLVWSSTPCDGNNGYMVVDGWNGDQGDQGSLCFGDLTSSFRVRCCADVY